MKTAAPPTSKHAEAQVVGCVFLTNGSCLPDILKVGVSPADFTDDRLRELWSAGVKRHRNGDPVDAALVCSDLEDSEYHESLPDLAAYLGAVMEGVATAAHAEHYAKILRNKSLDRQTQCALLDGLDELGKGKPGRSVINEVHATLDDLLRSTGTTSKRFNLITAAELAKGNYAVDYLVDGVLVDGQPCILGGPKKALKTTIMAALGIALVTETKFLDRFNVSRPCRVLMASGESGLATLQETSRRLCTAAGFHLHDLGADLQFCEDLPKFDNLDHLGELESIIDGEGFDVVMIDPAYKCMPSADAGNLMAQGNLLDAMAGVCTRQKATFILAHHAKSTRERKFDPLDLDDLAWAGFAEFARQWLLLNRREPYEPGTGHHELWLTAGGSAGHSGYWGLSVDEGTGNAFTGRTWSVEVQRGADIAKDTIDQKEAVREQRRDAKQQRQIESDCTAVVKAMSKLGVPETQKEIANVARLPGGRVKAALVDLTDQGHVREGEPTKKANGQTYPTYELVNGDE